ncbi:hypothetical protein HKD37_07G019389 [Glycine soja]
MVGGAISESQAASLMKNLLEAIAHGHRLERKQGFFSMPKDEVVHGLSPTRSCTKSPARSASPMFSLLRHHRKHHTSLPVLFIVRSRSLRPSLNVNKMLDSGSG